ncbi:FGGY-family carbohydrate kinase [Labrys monachus]|uniref:Sugar (Pentulose or hexulose) kinase n=1 Tax=Labrys monachus TaxID=217067 RepID=A0ABU0FNJ7_9HYPH|nr:sugar kinase [Labrys monachus]MDQ0396188.1 sugar (pentulose or hexulose) kinase [Labrys monachus]
MPVTAVLDVGKTNVKLVLFEGTAVLWQASTPNRSLPAPPYPHADVEAIWRFLMAGLREAARHHAIEDIVVTSHGATLALVGDGELALPVMDYEFAGVDAIETAYAPFRPPFAETLSPPISAGLNAGKQVFYQEAMHPEAFARVRHILPYAQYFAWRLTGIARGEVTGLGCHADLWAIPGGHLSSLATRRGWEPLFPPMVPAYAVIGPPSSAVLAETGLPPTVRVRAGIHDSSGSLLPHLLAIEPPFTVISTGTWVVIMALGAAAARLDPARDMLAYADVEGRGVPAAKFMGGREFAIILADGGTACDETDVAAAIAAGVLALPSFVANGGPFPGRPAAIRGSLPAGDGMRAALASLYCALVTDYLLEALDAARGPLVIEGSFALNRCYCGILAALRPGQDVLTGADGGGTAYGASLLAIWPQGPERPPMARTPAYADAEGLLRYRALWRAALASS